jgi:hypothetical protein
MKIFCDTHGQPLTHDAVRDQYGCKMDGCPVQITADTVRTLSGGMRTIKVTEIWLAPK